MIYFIIIEKRLSTDIVQIQQVPMILMLRVLVKKKQIFKTSVCISIFQRGTFQYVVVKNPHTRTRPFFLLICPPPLLFMGNLFSHLCLMCVCVCVCVCMYVFFFSRERTGYFLRRAIDSKKKCYFLLFAFRSLSLSLSTASFSHLKKKMKI